MNGCDCKECKDKQMAMLSGIELAQKKIDEKFRKGMYTVGLPKQKILEAINEAKLEVK